MTRFDLVVFLLCLPFLMGCKDNTPAIIKQMLMQEQKAIIELRMKRHASVQEKILACDHDFRIDLNHQCAHCGILPSNFVFKKF